MIYSDTLPLVPLDNNFNNDKYNFRKKLSRIAHVDTHKIPSGPLLIDALCIKKEGSKKYTIFFQDTRHDMTKCFDLLKFIHNYSSILIFDYSTPVFNKMTFDIARQNAIDVWKYTVLTMGISPSDIYLFGKSVGCHVAIELHAFISRTFDNLYYPTAVILNSPIWCDDTMTKYITNVDSSDILSTIKYPLQKISIKEPLQYVNHCTEIIIAHSPQDEIVPYSESVDMFNNVSQWVRNIKFTPKTP